MILAKCVWMRVAICTILLLSLHKVTNHVTHIHSLALSLFTCLFTISQISTTATFVFHSLILKPCLSFLYQDKKVRNLPVSSSTLASHMYANTYKCVCQQCNSCLSTLTLQPSQGLGDNSLLFRTSNLKYCIPYKLCGTLEKQADILLMTSESIFKEPSTSYAFYFTTPNSTGQLHPSLTNIWHRNTPQIPIIVK